MKLLGCTCTLLLCLVVASWAQTEHCNKPCGTPLDCGGDCAICRLGKFVQSQTSCLTNILDVLETATVVLGVFLSTPLSIFVTIVLAHLVTTTVANQSHALPLAKPTIIADLSALPKVLT